MTDAGPFDEGLASRVRDAADGELPALFERYRGQEEAVARLWFARGETASASRTAADQRIGPYACLDILGVGGQGTVWRARDSRTGRIVALKVLPARPRRPGERLLQDVRHPAVAELLDFDFDSVPPYVVTRFVDGTALRDVFAAGDASVGDAETRTRWRSRLLGSPGATAPAAALRWVEELLRALHDLHGAGLVHADLHPGNLLVTVDGRVRILDFGSARRESVPDGDATGNRGRGAFASPEARGDAPLDARTDQYSVAAILTAMALGDADDPRWLARSAEVEPTPLRVVLRKALAEDRRDRFATAAAFADELRRIRIGADITTGAPSRFALAMRAARRNPWPMLAVAALVVMTAVAVASWRTATEGAARAMAAAHYGGSLLRHLAREGIVDQRYADLPAPEGDALAGSGMGLALVESGSLLRRAGRGAEATRVLDAAAAKLGKTALTAASGRARLEGLLARFDAGEPPAEAPGDDPITGPVAAMLTAIDDNDGDGATSACWRVLDQGQWPTASLAVECRLLASHLLLDLGAEGPQVLRLRATIEQLRLEAGADGAMVDTAALLAAELACKGGEFGAGARLRATACALERALGPSHPWSLRGRRLAASTLLREHRPHAALHSLRSLVAVERELLGARHCETRRTEHCLALALQATAGAEAPERVAAALRNPTQTRLQAEFEAADREWQRLGAIARGPDSSSARPWLDAEAWNRSARLPALAALVRMQSGVYSGPHAWVTKEIAAANGGAAALRLAKHVLDGALRRGACDASARFELAAMFFRQLFHDRRRAGRSPGPIVDRLRELLALAIATVGASHDGTCRLRLSLGYCLLDRGDVGDGDDAAALFADHLRLRSQAESGVRLELARALTLAGRIEAARLELASLRNDLGPRSEASEWIWRRVDAAQQDVDRLSR